MAVKVALVVVLLVVAATPMAESAISCGQVTGSLAPCIAYLRGAGGPVPGPCCGGIKSLNSAAKTTHDRQAACTCIKSIASAIKGFNYGLASSLPANCGVPIPYKLSPSTDCKSVK